MKYMMNNELLMGWRIDVADARTEIFDSIPGVL
jgi:hypothetical protein